MITFKEIADHTLPNDTDEAERILSRYVGPEEYRVQLAILRLAEGVPASMQNFLDRALINHEKILALAEEKIPDFPKTSQGHIE